MNEKRNEERQMMLILWLEAAAALAVFLLVVSWAAGIKPQPGHAAWMSGPQISVPAALSGTPAAVPS